MKTKSSIKIIAGKFKGIALKMPTSTLTRSSKAILKESLFNTLGGSVIDTIFIEAFSGTGSIGLEALSRGAKEALFFEQDKNAFDILSSNIAYLQSKDPNLLAQKFLGDTFVLLPNRVQNISGKIILYLDPPFDFRENYQNIYQKCFDLVENIAHSNPFLIIFEHQSDYKLPKNLAHFSIIKQKKFGKSSLSYYASSQNTKDTNA